MLEELAQARETVVNILSESSPLGNPYRLTPTMATTTPTMCSRDRTNGSQSVNMKYYSSQ